MDSLVVFQRAKKWIKNNTIERKGISVTSTQRVIYPEVTGYYISTLLEWGERELAVSYAKHLCQIQKDDGSWYDAYDKEPYVFDTAQILKGLLAVRELLPDVEGHIIKGCDWMLGQIDVQGRLITPSKAAWGNDDDFCSELIHLYCLTPLMDAADIYKKEEYYKEAIRVKEYYISNYHDRIVDFSLLSHFYAYVMDGLLDLGERDLVWEAMRNIEKLQNRKGGIPGLKDVKWVCSTGMFQLAIVWYKLGELERGNKLFSYACSLQNESGGWYGSYSYSWLDKHARGKKKAYYFPDQEISWAVKYFLDALACKTKLEFENKADTFLDTIDETDGRYLIVEQEIQRMSEGKTLNICDVGGGKGRYLKNLCRKVPENKYHIVDISMKVMDYIKYDSVSKKLGRLTYLPYADNYFDVVYCCEALEHAIDVETAFRELWRITKENGRIIIIDKPVEKLGQLAIEEWEQWIDGKMLGELTKQFGGHMDIVSAVPYENKNDGLFSAWIIEKRER